VYVVADDTAMAAEDLGRDWKRERRPAWVIDTGLPATGDLTPETAAGLSAEDRSRVVAIALGETAGSADPRWHALANQLSRYRDLLDAIDRSQAVGMDM
jgi:hypothetical protein